MRKLLLSLVVTTLPLALITACSSNNSNAIPQSPVTTQSSESAITPFDQGPTSLHAAGATFPAQAYNQAIQPVGLATGTQPGPGASSLFAKYGGTGTIYYCLTGSGFGKKIFVGSNTAGSTAACAPLDQSPTGAGGRVDPLDFVGSDAALKSTEYTTYASVRKSTLGEPFELPAIGGPIVFGYKQTDLPGLGTARLKLSRWTYCAIANGTITNWNDAAITQDNGKSVTNGASLALSFFFRSDGSGTSYLFQNHLNTVCGTTWAAPYNAAPYQSTGRNANWGKGTSTTWLGPTTGNFAGASGNPGVLAAIQSKAGGTGYVEGAYAKVAANPAVAQALLQNQNNTFADPTVAANVKAALQNVTSTSVTLGGGSDNINLGSVGDTRTDCILFVNPSNFANPTIGGAYPIVGVSYLLFYGKNNGVHITDKKKLVNFINSSTGNIITSSFEYTSLSSSLQNLVLAAANGTGSYSGKACLQ